MASSGSDSESEASGDQKEQDRSRSRSRDRKKGGEKRLSFKEFLLYKCGDHIKPEEAQEQYDQYVTEFDKSEARIFYDNHHTEEWFIDHYDPVRQEELLAENRERTKFMHDIFKHNLQNNKVPELYMNCEQDRPKEVEKIKSEPSDSIRKKDEGWRVEPGIRVRVGPGNKYSNQLGRVDKWIQSKQKWGITLDSKEKVALSTDQLGPEVKPEGQKKKVMEFAGPKGGPEDKKSMKKKENRFFENSIFIQGIPLTVKRDELLTVFEKVTGFKKLIISDPIRNPRKIRWAWVEFETQSQCGEVIKDTAMGGLNGYKLTSEYFLNLLPKKKSFREPKTVPPISLHPERIGHDIDQCTRLVRKLDEEAGIEENFIFEEEVLSDFDDLKQLNLLIAYLRFVHLFTYYGSRHYMTEDHFSARCSLPHKRQRGPASEPDYEHTEPTEWEKELDEKIDQFLDRPDPLAEGNTWEERTRRDFLDDNTIKVTEGKYRCRDCKKLFRAPRFVHKHTMHKHLDKVDEHMVKKRRKTFFRNYRTDEFKITESWFLPDKEDLMFDAKAGAPNRELIRGSYGRSRREPYRMDAGAPGFGRVRQVPEHFSGRSNSRTHRSYQEVNYQRSSDDEIDYGFGDYQKAPKFNL